MIESSDDGINFRTLKTITASALTNYNLLAGRTYQISNDLADKSRNTIRTVCLFRNVYVDNICNTQFEAGLYPNPVPTNVTDIPYWPKSGIFNGKYSIALRNLRKRTEAN